ncbi:MAG: diadenylate cyclase [Candidatus Methanofastidiosa archaeon]|nr:diadenylate cyclase [Candidatus Methanofastidiosa archaeon]
MEQIIFQKGFELAKAISADAVLFCAQSKKDIELAKANELFYEINPILVITDRSLRNRCERELFLAADIMNVYKKAKICIAGAVEEGFIKMEDLVVFIDTLWEESDNAIITMRAMPFMDNGIYTILTHTSEIDPLVIYHALRIIIQLGKKGREGKPVGTTFIIGDSGDVMRHSSQITYNPFEGSYVEISDKTVVSMIKEYSRLDGAFIISGKGKIVAASRYLESGKDDLVLPAGLGARHMSAAWMSKITNEIAVVLSESDNMIRIFSKGQLVLELDPKEMGG